MGLIVFSFVILILFVVLGFLSLSAKKKDRSKIFKAGMSFIGILFLPVAIVVLVKPLIPAGYESWFHGIGAVLLGIGLLIVGERLSNLVD